MKKSNKTHICIVSKDGTKLLCNNVDRNGDGELWETKSGKWIPINIENAPVVTSALTV